MAEKWMGKKISGDESDAGIFLPKNLSAFKKPNEETGAKKVSDEEEGDGDLGGFLSLGPQFTLSLKWDE